EPVPATGVTKFYGEQTFCVDSVAPNEYYLRDLSRGNGVFTFDESSNEPFRNDSNYWDLTNENQDEVAIDAHFSAVGFYDLMKERFNWDGLDNEGRELNTIIHAGNFVNAFWTGEAAVFGDGDCNNGPLTTLEVVGHEFMHGVTQFTSGLIYASESGAINESMSDLFGKALEYYTDPSYLDWSIGHSFLLTDYASPFRSFEDPNIHNHPKFYKGDFWFDGGGVHTNSSVGNHWFYLLVNGANGVTPNGDSYDIQGIGFEKAIQIAFLTETAYLMPSSDYNFYYETSQQAAIELFGDNSPELADVTEAWKAVGLPYSSGVVDLDLAISFEDRFVQTCLANEFHPLEIIVSNVSTVDFTQQVFANINIENGDRIVPITEDIPAGEQITIIVDDYLYFSDEGNEAVDVDLDVLDANGGNNSTLYFVQNAFYPNNDMRLVSAEFSRQNCEDNELTRVNFNVTGNSCNPIPSGTSFYLSMTDNNAFFWEKEFVLDGPLYRGFIQTFSEDLIIDITGATLMEMRLIFADDVNNNNNEAGALFNRTLPVSAGYLNEFDGFDNHIALYGDATYQIGTYQNENYFMTTGFSTFPFVNLCPNPDDMFETFAPIVEMQFCVDLEDQNSQDVSLAFDMLQFRNEDGIDYPELYDNTSVLKVTWGEGFEEEEAVFYGHQEGILNNHIIPLPNEFKGQVTFEFFNNTGNAFSSSGNYLDYDVIMIDNLQLDAVVNTKEALTQSLTILPNPSNGLFYLSFPELPQWIRVHNIQGQELLRKSGRDDLEVLDLSHLPDSYYMLSAQFADGSLISQAIAKISK
ncbi:MAG: M4 family metallopeptidase, partial [Bacteroidota bacterium]